MPRLGRSIARFTAFCASLCLAAPAAAQFDIQYPDTPPAEGQTLLEWARPPVLDYTIPEEQRDDVSTCSATHEYDLDLVATTCWPILRALQIWTLASFAQGEPNGDKDANQRQAIGYADEVLDFIGEPQWPLHEHMRSKALETKLSALVRLEDWDAALVTARELLDNVSSDLMKFDDFRRGFAHRRYGELLLQAGKSDEARADLETARELFYGPEGDKVGWPLSNYSEAVISDAIRQGDLRYAEDATNRYLAHIRTLPDGFQFGIDDHRDLKLYLLAAAGDVDDVLALLDERFSDERPYNRCKDGPFKFPQVLAPLRDDEAIVARLREGGCKTADIAGMEAVVKYGIVNRSGEVLLPYPSAN